MIKRLFAGALFAGLSAGALAALLQLTFVVPLIHLGELYETGALVHFGIAGSIESSLDAVTIAPPESVDPDGHAAGGHVAPSQGGLTRTISSFAMFLVSYTGFALVLVSAFALAEQAGQKITARNGAIWGLCGFIAFQLAPAFGLPPELPGAKAAALELRQVWWAGCVLATAIGLALLAFGRGPVVVVFGAVIIALPHLLGAPIAEFGGVAPPELAAHFATRVLGAGAICWVLLGTVGGAFWSRNA